MTELAEWESFYLIVGPSAGPLIGLQFVVLTLFAGIHNSWDSISYHVFVVRNRPPADGGRDAER